MKELNKLFLLFLCAWLSGCSDFLEESSQDEQIMKTVKDYEEMVSYYTTRDANTYNFIELLTDDITVTEKLASNSSSIIVGWYPFYTWQPDMWEKKSVSTYANTYKNILGMNVVLDEIDGATDGTQTERELIKARALALRSYYYFILVNLFGEPYNYNKEALGVPLKLRGNTVTNGIARNTVAEVYDQIVKDLELAISLFERKEKVRDWNMNITSTCILLSRVYLYMEEWDKAIQTADKAITTSAGLTDYTKITAEKLLLATYELSETEWVTFFATNVSFSGDYSFFYSTELFELYSDQDARKKFWLSGRIGKMNYVAADYKCTCAMGISEAYLNRAEAYVRLQKNTEAMADVNTLRRNRIADYTDETVAMQADMLETVKTERRKELCYTGHRWFDLRRYGMPAITHRYKPKAGETWTYYTLEEKDPLYTLPLPAVAFDNNVKLEQNASAYVEEREGMLEENTNE